MVEGWGHGTHGIYHDLGLSRVSWYFSLIAGWFISEVSNEHGWWLGVAPVSGNLHRSHWDGPKLTKDGDSMGFKCWKWWCSGSKRQTKSTNRDFTSKQLVISSWHMFESTDWSCQTLHIVAYIYIYLFIYLFIYIYIRNQHQYVTCKKWGFNLIIQDTTIPGIGGGSIESIVSCAWNVIALGVNPSMIPWWVYRSSWIMLDIGFHCCSPTAMSIHVHWWHTVTHHISLKILSGQYNSVFVPSKLKCLT